MADRFWVGGTGNWSSSTRWSATSGGSSGAGVPTTADNVFFDANSGTGTATITPGAVCRSIDCDGYTGTLTHPTAIMMSIGDGTAGAGNRALRFSSTMNYTSATSTSIINFVSTSATQQTIDFAEKSINGNLTFNGVGGSWQFVSGFTSLSNTLTFTAGAVDFNGQTITCGTVTTSGSAVRSITMGASNFTCRGGNNVAWNTSATTNLTFDAGTSTITCNSPNGNSFVGGGFTYNNVILYAIGISVNISSANTFTNLTIIGYPGIRNAAYGITSNQTVTGVLTLTSDSAINRLEINAPSSIQRTFTLGTTGSVSIGSSDIVFMGINFTGTNTPVSGGILGDGGNNNNITFSASQTNYWVGSAGDGLWSSPNNWASTPGGVGGTGRVPLAHDDVVLTGSSPITLDVRHLGRHLDFTAHTGGVTNGGSGITKSWYGNLALGSNISTDSGVWTPHGIGSFTIDTNGYIFGPGLSLSSFLLTNTSTITLLDHLTLGSTLTQSSGNFDTNDFNVTCPTFNATSANIRTIDLGTSTITLTGTGNIWDMTTSPNLTLLVSNATLDVTNTTSSSRTVDVYRSTYGKIRYNANGTGVLILDVVVTGTMTTLECRGLGAKTLRFTSGDTFNITNFLVRGNPGNVVTIEASTSGSATTISKASGIVATDHVSIKDITATGGATFYAGVHSTNVSGNTGWIFSSKGPKMRVSGSFVDKVTKYRSGGSFAVKTINSRTGGVFKVL